MAAAAVAAESTLPLAAAWLGHAFSFLQPADQAALRGTCRDGCRAFDEAVANEVFIGLALSRQKVLLCFEGLSDGNGITTFRRDPNEVLAGIWASRRCTPDGRHADGRDVVTETVAAGSDAAGGGAKDTSPSGPDAVPSTADDDDDDDDSTLNRIKQRDPVAVAPAPKAEADPVPVGRFDAQWAPALYCNRREWERDRRVQSVFVNVDVLAAARAFPPTTLRGCVPERFRQGCVASSVMLRGATGVKTIQDLALTNCMRLTHCDFGHLDALEKIGSYFLNKCPKLVWADCRRLERLNSVGGGCGVPAAMLPPHLTSKQGLTGHCYVRADAPVNTNVSST